MKERQSLLDKAKKNKISNTELDRLGILNQQFQKNPTVGMGPIESVRYQFTNQQFKDDLAKARRTLVRYQLRLILLEDWQLESLVSLHLKHKLQKLKPFKCLWP